MTDDPISRVSDEPIDNALGPRLPFPTGADEGSRTAAPRSPRSLYDNGDRFGAGKPRWIRRSRPNRPAASRCGPWLWNAASILSLAVALVCLALVPPFNGKSVEDPEQTRLTSTTNGPSLPTIPIERIHPGDWALAHNPELTDEERWAAEHDEFGPVEAPDDWRLVSLRMEKPDGSDLQIELLRPLDWLDWYEVQVGAEIDLDLEELGADGPATVLAIHRCPQILPRPGPGYQLVTGRFAHSSAEVLDLVLIDAHCETTAIGVTASHPFWSEDQQAFVPAGHLTRGTRLLTATGDPIQLANITPRPGREPVFNIEVDVEHGYHVSATGVLVHNLCQKRGNAPNRRVIGKFDRGTNEIKGIRPGENSLLKHLPNQGSPKANWRQNSSVLRQEIRKGNPIRDTGVKPDGTLIDYPGSFLNAERNVLRNQGWAFDPSTGLWNPAK